MLPNHASLHRQQRLAFAKDDLWEKLPQEVQVECNRHLTRLLVRIIIHEHDERANDHERQDSF